MDISAIVESHIGKIKKKIKVSSSFCEIWHIDTTDGKFFLKHNNTIAKDTLICEADGLEFLRKNGLQVPRIVYTSNEILILEFIEAGNGNAFIAGENMGILHKHSGKEFGYFRDNFIADLPQKNTLQNNWPEFYKQNRILPQIMGLLEQKIISAQDKDFWEIFCNRIPALFTYEVHAVPLHGDLWSGNIVHGIKKSWFIDPSVYYGDALVDIAMTKLFGGFPAEFYDGYHSIIPAPDDIALKISLYQIYPLLVHARLFGGSYYQSAKSIAIHLGGFSHG